jgi:hypothetical protein
MGSGLEVIFRSWKDTGDMPGSSYAVQRHANDYINPMRTQLDELYAELQAYIEADPEEEEYTAEIAELRGKCWGLAWAIATFANQDSPNINEVRQVAHQRWLDSQESED